MTAVRTLGFADFTEFACNAMMGRRPYPYQQRLAADGLPELLRVPAGAGKTAAAVLPWLWRRMRYPNAIHDRLVYVLPLRSMVEPTARQVTAWLDRLGLGATVPVVTLTGGESARGGEWRRHPRHPAILIGTQDMVVSRLLMRGYGEQQACWPVTFGLLHCASQFVFDETALLGSALRTSLQLQGLREALGTARRCATMWMSATANPDDLVSPDHRQPVRVVELGAADRADERLAQRLDATRTVRRAALTQDPALYPGELARALAGWHVPGTATIAVVNTAERAVAVYDALERAAHAADLLLLHAGFRPQERSLTAALLDSAVPSAGRIVVATQVIEAGVDTSCQTMFTELAPWSSIMHRAGRCNRGGDRRGAVLRWARPPGAPAGTSAAGWSAAPYDERGMAAAHAALESLEGVAVTSSQLADRLEVRSPRDRLADRAVRPALRMQDLLLLFDSAAPELGGPEIDITPWVGDGEAMTVLVAWRFWPDGVPAAVEPAPEGDELCPVPLDAVRARASEYWIWDQVDGQWRRCGQADVRPGAVVLADAAAGGYVADRGWSPRSSAGAPAAPVRQAAAQDAVDRDPASFTGCWVDLRTHLADTERELRALTEDWRSGQEPDSGPAGLGPDGGPAGPGPAGLTLDQLEAAAFAARFHDLGKAFGPFQDWLRDRAADRAPGDGPWAKSTGRGGRNAYRPYLRHELVTALALLHPDCGLLDGVEEADLVVYLAATHHGKVRLRVGSVPGESGHDPPRIMGVQDGDGLPRLALWDGAEVPPLILDTATLGLAVNGGAGGSPLSWTARMSALRDRPDVGPFRLAFLETLVRIADWRASQAPSYAASLGAWADPVRPVTAGPAGTASSPG